MNLFRKLFGGRQEELPKQEPEVSKKDIPVAMISQYKPLPKSQLSPVEPYRPMPGVVPEMAVDAAMSQDNIPYDWVNDTIGYQVYFPGYPTLAQWATRPEFRKIVTTIAEEMTREGIELSSVGDDDSEGQVRQDKIDKMNKEIERVKLMAHLRKQIEDDGYFGRGHIYIDLEMPKGSGLVSDNPDELSSPLIVDKSKIPVGSFKGLVNVEPMWTYPGIYNSTNPLRPDYYKPNEWYVFQKLTHHTRLKTMIRHEVPDMLKAAFAFGGVSTAQLCEPYINNWISTRDSVKDLIHSFSTSGIMTDMTNLLAGNGPIDIFDRAEFYNEMRDNRGLMLLNKETEEFFQVNTPVSGISDLQAQSEEQMAIVPGIPLVKLLGITPSGLNASSDGEIRVFYDSIAAMQEADLRDEVKEILDIMQLSLFGEIDEAITFDFRPLYQLSEKEQSEVMVNESTAANNYVTMGALAPEEVREKIIADKRMGFNGLSLESEYDLGGEDGEEPEGYEEGEEPDRNAPENSRE